MIRLFKKAYFLWTKVNISQNQLNHLISHNLSITFCDVDRIDCENTWVQFAPLRCKKASHEDFIYDDPQPTPSNEGNLVGHEVECQGFLF